MERKNGGTQLEQKLELPKQVAQDELQAVHTPFTAVVKVGQMGTQVPWSRKPWLGRQEVQVVVVWAQVLHGAEQSWQARVVVFMRVPGGQLGTHPPPLTKKPGRQAVHRVWELQVRQLVGQLVQEPPVPTNPSGQFGTQTPADRR